jgi:hypothetical protein
MLRGANSGKSGRCAGLAALVILIGGWQTPPAPAPSKLPTAQEINSVLRELADITGFHIRRQLPFASITREQVNAYLKEQIRQSVKPDEIRAEETTLKKFGFVPVDFDLKQTTIDLLTEQAAAFYDFKRKKLFISDWATVNMRDVALIHELAHALADQNFPIKQFLAKAGDDSEASLARQAVVEGQASWLMIEVGARRAGRTLADEELARQYLNNDLDSPDEDYPVFNKAPLYLRKTLIFPYSEGGRFQQAVFLHDGNQAFARVFQKPPVSSAQILHPMRYFENTGLQIPDLPKPLKHTKPFITGIMGELGTRILIEQYAGADLAEQLGPKLKGASYRIDESKPDHRLMLLYVSDWSDEDAASRYLAAYRQILHGKWKQLDIADDGAGGFSGKSEDGYFMVARNGKQVLSEEGFAQTLEPPLHATR